MTLTKQFEAILHRHHHPENQAGEALRMARSSANPHAMNAALLMMLDLAPYSTLQKGAVVEEIEARTPRPVEIEFN